MMENHLEDSKYNSIKTATELENTQRELDSMKGMMSMIELQHNEYVSRLRVDNK